MQVLPPPYKNNTGTGIGRKKRCDASGECECCLGVNDDAVAAEGVVFAANHDAWGRRVARVLLRVVVLVVVVVVV